eukprot:90863_1
MFTTIAEVALIHAILCQFNHFTVNATIEAYEGSDPMENTSPIFLIELKQDDNSSNILYPHVYYTKVNNSNYEADCPHLQPAFFNRTVSWIEFGQQSNDTTLITVTLQKPYVNLFNIKPNNINILPLNYNIIPKLIINNKNEIEAVSFNVSGNYKSMSLEYGHECNLTLNNTALCYNSSFKDSLLIFIGNLSPHPHAPDIYFSAGSHNITTNNTGNGGILKTNVSEIYFERGAFVYGKIECLEECNIIGYGILCGSRFNHTARRLNPEDHQRMITASKPLNLYGLTILDPSARAIQLAPSFTHIKSWKYIAWYYNNGGIGLFNNSILSDSFIRTNDDSIILEYGGNNTIQSNVIWQLFNGGVFQFGWAGNGTRDILINDTDIIHTEWRGNYVGDTSNDAVIDLNTPYLDGTEYTKRVYENISILNTRVDTAIGRFFGVRFYNVSEEESVELNNWNIKNVNITQIQHWFVSDGYGPLFLNISNCCIINGKVNVNVDGILFDQIYMNQTHILNNIDWNLIVNNTDSDCADCNNSFQRS